MRSTDYDIIFDMSNENDSHVKILKSVKSGSVVLEFGPANGAMTEYLKNTLGCRVYIVELNENSFLEAMAFADDGFFGDANGSGWLNKFSDITFDYVLFGDILEHLYNPSDVLQQSISLLKDDGRVLISVPNIAHNSIIINLLQSKFEYKREGLLDKTHIRFFTYYSLLEVLDSVGLVAVTEDATILSSLQTEFGNSYNDISGNIRILKENQFGNVYQFIFECVKKNYYYSNKDSLKISKKISNSTNVEKGATYFDTGNGFSESEKFICRYEGENFRHEINLPLDTKAIRFDPLEGYSCIISHFEVISDKGNLDYKNVNGYTFGASHLFLTKNPQILIEIPIDTSWVVIEAKIHHCEDDFIIRLFSHLVGATEKLKVDVEKEILNLSDELNNRNIELTTSKEELELRTSELNASKAEYHIAIQQRDAYIVLLAQMQNAAFWRLTRPARTIVDTVKYMCRKTPGIKLLYKFLLHTRCLGFRAAVSKTKNYFFRKNAISNMALNLSLSKDERKAQENTVFPSNIKISIITPLYNTPINFLTELIESVLAQTYKNLELCLADGSNEQHSEVQRICERFAKKDKRIKYRKLEQNLGISENSNAAIEMSDGDYLGFLDHDDLLHPSALFEVMKAISENSAEFVYTDEATFENTVDNLININYKPDYAIDNLRSCNYITHFSVVSKDLIEKVGMLKSEFDGSQDHDIILRLTDEASKIYHIPKVLYFWRLHPDSVASNIGAKPYAIESGKGAVLANIRAHGMDATVESHWCCPTFYRIKYDLTANPKISIIIPNKDSLDILTSCISSILKLTTYENYEIIIAENNSQEDKTFEYYREIESSNNRVKIVYWSEKRFNYSKINNFAVKYASGEQILFLNNDVEIITPNWIEEMLMYSQRSNVGAVGIKLYYPDDTIQHAGVVLGLGAHRVAGHLFYGLPRNEVGYMGRLWISQNMSAVTGACMMVRKEMLEKVGMLTTDFSSSFGDIDLCMKIRKAGYLIVWTPHVEAYHYESKTRGSQITPDKVRLFEHEVSLFKNIWAKELAAGDPYYNVNFSLDKSDYSFR